MARTTFLAALLLGICVPQLAFGDESPAVADGLTPKVHQSVERAIGYLQTESGTWLSQRHCAACHHAAMPLMALGEAGKLGYTIDKKFLADKGEGALGSNEKMMASGLVNNPASPPDTRPMARGVNMGLPFIAVAAQSFASLDAGQKKSLKWIVTEILNKQQPDGSWEFFLSRPPINETQATDVAWMIMALQGETGPEIPDSHRAALKKAIEKAIAWLDKAEPAGTHQLKALKLMVAVRAGTPRSKLQNDVAKLLAMQQADGGWNQLDNSRSDAFATGETLYVLALAGRTAEQPEMKRGIEFLLATQKADGSWPMKSRATPDGRPGSAKLLTPITCGATSWATLALARLEPE